MLSGTSILIIEDNAFLALDLAMAVEACNGRVVGPFATGTEAWSALEGQPVSAAVLDCGLVDCDITPIAVHLAAQGVPVVVHSCAGLPPALAQAYPQWPVMLKPLQPHVIIDFLVAEIAKARLTVRHYAPDIRTCA